MIDWDEIQRKAGLCEEDWRIEVSIENPQCPILERNGHLPNPSSTKMVEIFNATCTFCSLWPTPPREYPSCPWAARMAEEVLAFDQL